MKLNNIIDLNSYIRIDMIRKDFQNECIYVSSMEELKGIDIYKCKNIIFETSQLKNLFYEGLQLKDVNHTVINCLSSNEIVNSLLNEATGLVIFDNVCGCKNNYILETVMKYKDKKLLVC